MVSGWVPVGRWCWYILVPYQFDGHVFVGVQVLAQPQLSEVPTADLLADAEVWSDHQDPGVGAGAAAAVARPAPRLGRHPLALLRLTFSPAPAAARTPLVKVHQLVVAWSLHGYAGSMHPSTA